MFWYTVIPGIVLLVFIIIGIVLWTRDNSAQIFLSACLGGLILGACVAGIGYGIAYAASPATDSVQTINKSGPIYLHALASDKNLSGSVSGGFLLATGGMSGTVSENYVYHYLYFTNGKVGGFTSETMNQDISLVFEDTATNPYFYRITYTNTCPEQHPTFFQVKKCIYRSFDEPFLREFHIPKGSVVKEYYIEP